MKIGLRIAGLLALPLGLGAGQALAVPAAIYENLAAISIYQGNAQQVIEDQPVVGLNHAQDGVSLHAVASSGAAARAYADAIISVGGAYSIFQSANARGTYVYFFRINAAGNGPVQLNVSGTGAMTGTADAGVRAYTSWQIHSESTAVTYLVDFAYFCMAGVACDQPVNVSRDWTLTLQTNVTYRAAVVANLQSTPYQQSVSGTAYADLALSLSQPLLLAGYSIEYSAGAAPADPVPSPAGLPLVALGLAAFGARRACA